MKCTSSFTYLGSTVTSEGGSAKDIRCRIVTTRDTLIELGNIWKAGQISQNTKMRLYNRCVLPVMLYGAEC